MFYSLGKAAKVHVMNLTSPQRGLALIAFRNILKTVKIYRFYEQNNIMSELASQMIASLENVLISNQDRFSNEETIEISNVPPTTAPTHIKISPTMSNQMFHPEAISKSMQTMDPKRESSSSTNNMTSNFTYIQNQGGGMQQFLPVNQIFDSFAMQMQSPTMMMSNEISPNEQQYWDMDNLVGGYNNHPYNNITSLPTTASSASTTALSTTAVVTSAADYFSHHQQQPPQRQSSLPSTTPIPMYPPPSTKSHSRSN